LLVDCLLLPVKSAAQDGANDLVYVEPGRCFFGGTVKVFGWVKPNHPGSTSVSLEFVKPVSGKTLRRQVIAQPDGQYQFLFEDTDETGTWKVSAWKTGSRTRGETGFDVSRTVFLIPLCLEVKLLDGEIQATYDFLRELLEKYPDFPGREDMIKNIKMLFLDLDRRKAILSVLEGVLRQMNQALAQSIDLPEPALDEFIKAASKVDQAINETGKQAAETKEVRENSKQEAEWCYLWMAYHDLCDQLKFYNNFLADSLKDIAQNLLAAALVSGLDPGLQNDIGLVVDALTGSPDNPIFIANKIMNKLADLGGSVYGQLMNHCTVYSGEAEGEYHAELLCKGMPFYSMDYKTTGHMDLTFQKRKPGDPALHLKGRYKGQAGDFACSINMAPFAMPDTIGPVWCLSKTPLVADRSFFLYLEGKATRDSLELKLEKVGRDFKLKSRAFYVLLSSAAFHLPIPGDFAFPLQDGEWFLTRVTRTSSPDIEYFQLPVTAEGDMSKAEQDFERTIHLPETQKRFGVRVVMKLKIKVCSPGCK
jgi:hypothetical protein